MKGHKSRGLPDLNILILMISQINVVFFGSMKKPAGLLKDRFILNSSTTRYRDMNLMTHSYHGNVICLTI